MILAIPSHESSPQSNATSCSCGSSVLTKNHKGTFLLVQTKGAQKCMNLVHNVLSNDYVPRTANREQGESYGDRAAI